MTESATEAAVRQFLLSEVLYDRDMKELAADHSLIDRGLLDSLGILKTVTYCEEHFGIRIPDHEVLPDNFENVRAIARLVERYRAAAK
jgi:acyl carrier protein